MGRIKNVFSKGSDQASEAADAAADQAQAAADATKAGAASAGQAVKDASQVAADHVSAAADSAKQVGPMMADDLNGVCKCVSQTAAQLAPPGPCNASASAVALAGRGPLPYQAVYECVPCV
jgi:hypothetical protein